STAAAGPSRRSTSGRRYRSCGLRTCVQTSARLISGAPRCGMGHSLPVGVGTPEARDRAATHLRHQAQLTASSLYPRLLFAAADDADAGGPCWAALEGHERDPFSSALALRLLGGVHRLVLEGSAP